MKKRQRSHPRRSADPALTPGDRLPPGSVAPARLPLPLPTSPSICLPSSVTSLFVQCQAFLRVCSPLCSKSPHSANSSSARPPAVSGAPAPQPRARSRCSISPRPKASSLPGALAPLHLPPAAAPPAPATSPPGPWFPAAPPCTLDPLSPPRPVPPRPAPLSLLQAFLPLRHPRRLTPRRCPLCRLIPAPPPPPGGGGARYMVRLAQAILILLPCGSWLLVRAAPARAGPPRTRPRGDP